MKSNKPLILITNDDGIFAPGIKALIEVASEHGDIVVVAPDSPQSGQGHAITLKDILRLRKVDTLGSIEAYECSGTPVDCVKLAKNVILKDREISLCVSGINHGSNASINIIYSGTMSAAMEASIEGIPSIGFSLDHFGFDADFEPAKKAVNTIISTVLKQGMGAASLLNVNIPYHEDGSKLKGIKICIQSEGTWVEDFDVKKDPYGKEYYWLTGEFIHHVKEGEFLDDISAMKQGYVSVVPCMHDLTDYTNIKDIKFLED